MNDITNRFKIENKELINFENKIFPILHYASELHGELAYRLQDPNLAKMIHSPYEKELKQFLNKEEQNLFEHALLKVCYLFGCPKYPPHLGLHLALKEENFPVLEWMQKNEIPFKNFMNAANQNLYPFKQPKHSETRKHIVITTTTAAGGNLVVAEGLKNCLEKHYKVTILDIEKLSENIDPLKIATGTHTYDKIYAEVIQQKNLLEKGFELQMKIGREVARYIEPTLGKVLKETILDLHPHFILSTRNGHELDITLPHSLGIPGCTMHCDSEVGYYYNNFVGKLDSQLFKIWLPEDHSRVFKPVFERVKKSWKEFDNSSWEIFKKPLALALDVSSEVLENQIEFVGAPTRPEIKLIQDEEEIKLLKRKWKLREGEEGVIVTLGQNGVGKMKDIFEELLKASAHNTLIKYYFVCGTNHLLKTEFEEKLKTVESNHTALQRCAILGFLSGAEMNELLNISRLVIGKPGGSQKEECLTIGIPLMIVFSHEYWESGNQAKMEKEGFSLTYHSEQSLADQTERHVLALKDKKLVRPKQRKWKQLIPIAIGKVLNL